MSLTNFPLLCSVIKFAKTDQWKDVQTRMDMEIKQTLLGQTVSETMKLKRK